MDGAHARRSTQPARLPLRCCAPRPCVVVGRRRRAVACSAHCDPDRHTVLRAGLRARGIPPLLVARERDAISRLARRRRRAVSHNLISPGHFLSFYDKSGGGARGSGRAPSASARPPRLVRRSGSDLPRLRPLGCNAWDLRSPLCAKLGGFLVLWIGFRGDLFLHRRIPQRSNTDPRRSRESRRSPTLEPPSCRTQRWDRWKCRHRSTPRSST